MSGDEDLAAVLRRHRVDAGLLRRSQDLYLGMLLDVLAVNRRVARVRDQEDVVVSAEQHMRLPLDHVREHAEELFLQRVLRDPEVVVEPCLRAPADVERRVHVGLRPLHDLAELLPVIDFLERHLLDGSTGDDHTVERAVLHVVEVLVERQHVFGIHVLRLVRLHLQQLQMHLQRGVSQKARQLRLGRDLRGHQVQQQDLQRADVLPFRAGFLHDEDILFIQCFNGRKAVGYADRHIHTSHFFPFFHSE